MHFSDELEQLIKKSSATTAAFCTPVMKRTVTAAAGVLLLLCILHGSSASAAPRPNIIFILADDLGWSDVGWRNPFLHTPTLDKLAREGLILNQSYVQRSCSPSRAALMSGRYPYHIGFQAASANAGHAFWLPDDQPIMPEALKKLGYATHMIGKWHLGYCNWRYTPTYRGFDSFYGFYLAAQDYYTHIAKHGYDFRDNDQVDKTAAGHYSTNLYTDRAVRIINQHDASKPFFLYLAYQAVHTPFQVPQSYVDNYCSHISDHDRRIKCGMIAALDEGVHNVTQALQNQGLMNNTFIVFSSDNGGPVNAASSNWPLRGSKITIWEGGTRAVGFVHAPGYLQNTNASYEELLHISDWYPTFVEAAGGGRHVPNIDGVSHWKSLLRGRHGGPRDEFIYNINDVRNHSAIRQGRYKLTVGNPGNAMGWYVTPELEAYVNATSEVPHVRPSQRPHYRLYDLKRDPWERNNIILTHQDVFQRMLARLNHYKESILPTNQTERLHSADPKYFDGNWSPGWC